MGCVVAGSEAFLIQGSLARRYAKAIIAVASDDFEQVGSDLAAVTEAIFGSREAVSFFTSPTVGRELRANLLEQIISSAEFSASTASFLRLLSDRRRMAYLPAIVQAYSNLADEKASRLRARVTSAIPLPRETVHRIEAQLAAYARKVVSVEAGIDPSLLGGVVAQVGNVVYDGSLRTQLEALRRELAERV